MAKAAKPIREGFHTVTPYLLVRARPPGRRHLNPRAHDYGEPGASVKDPFGNHWYIATHRKDVAIS